MLTLEKVIVLKSVDIFRQVPEAHLVALAKTVVVREAHPGEIIIRHGELGTSMFIIVDGSVRVHRGDKEIAQLGSREVFGELAALDPEPRSATVTAIANTLLFEVEGSAIYDVMA